MIQRKNYFFLFFAASIVYIIGLFIKVMDVDAAQYAAISLEMLNNHHYLEIFNRGENYLDKPPLLFWLSVLAFKIFGISSIAYKLPSFLFALLGVYATYRLAKHLYDEQTGKAAALIVYTTQAFFLFNNDVRTDTLLTAFVIFSCWQLILFSDSNSILNLLLGFTGIALAMMAKGPIGAVVPASALMVHFMLKREWKKFFRWQWIAGVIITMLWLLPVIIGLYRQYGSEGPRFFLWTQSFGRITGENAWKNDTGYYYFLHVILWSLLPWSAVAAFALIYSLVKIFRTRFAQGSLTEYYSIGGFVLPFIALSFSQYKLPHYIFVLYPLAAIFSAAFLQKIVSENKKAAKVFSIIQLLIVVSMLAGVVIICTAFFPGTNIFLWLLAASGTAISIRWWWKPENMISRIVLPSALAAIVVNLLFNAHAYPALLKYQSGQELACIIHENQIPKDKVYSCGYSSYSFDFYFRQPSHYLSREQLKEKVNNQEHIWVIGHDDLIEMVKAENIPVKKVFLTDDYHVTTLSPTFLDSRTRASVVPKVYLIEF